VATIAENARATIGLRSDLPRAAAMSLSPALPWTEGMMPCRRAQWTSTASGTTPAPGA